MLSNAHFYNRTIRKIVVAFGSMLNDIQVVRYNRDGTHPKEIFKVHYLMVQKKNTLPELQAIQI